MFTIINWYSLALLENQINYFKDHVKLILCPLMGAVTVIDERKNFRTFKYSLLAEHGCTTDLLCRLQYAHDKLPFLLAPLAAEDGPPSDKQ